MESIKLLKTLNLLYVEDDNTLREEYTKILAGFFSTVYEAQNGMEALDLYEKKDIHLIITDNRMPIMDGLELIEEIRKKDDNLPICIMTSFSEKDELLKATRLKLTDYLIKPIGYSNLKTTLERLVQEIQKSKVLDFYITDTISYSPLRKVLKVDGIEYILPSKEALLLELFLKYSGKVVTKEMIADSVYDGEEMSVGGVKNLILKLRNKIGNELILTLRGSGYLLNVHNI
ncbi:response regulator transcription factor [Arcobacter sp.]|uniref:response regulator transcription factor n=1 Tax=Arcobacter sp. TaxID=1872629 RepID=UPI003D13141B